jgi:hypothetical protein
MKQPVAWLEAGLDIPEVSLVTGHKDWKTLQRYLNLTPVQLLLRKVRDNRYGSIGRRSSGPTGLYS